MVVVVDDEFSCGNDGNDCASPGADGCIAPAADDGGDEEDDGWSCALACDKGRTACTDGGSGCWPIDLYACD